MVDGGLGHDIMYAMRVAWSYMQRLPIMMSLVAENHGTVNLSPGGGTFEKEDGLTKRQHALLS